MNPHLDDTIVAISTPPGRGGLGVARLAGEQAVAIANQFVRSHNAEPLRFEPAKAKYALLVDSATNERIDEIVVTYFQAPHSYTTEDVVEISAHGSPMVLQHIVQQAISAGARLAEPGEFTMRAFLKGRIDLTQAEAVRDLIDSQTLFQAKAAAQQLNGALSKRLSPVKRHLLELIAALEAGVDFAEDDVAVLSDGQIASQIAAIERPLEELSASIAYGKMVHQGITLAIVGRPNVGKSSLFNRLVQREHAIVTATPGTTRDLVTETIALNGIPVKLIDTAGLRESEDEAEQMGIKKSYEALADADVVLMVMDATEHQASSDHDLIGRVHEQNANVLIVQNKADLLHDIPIRSASQRSVIFTSALRGEGIDQLRKAIIERVAGKCDHAPESGFLTNERQHAAVQDSRTALSAAQRAVRDGLPHEVLLLDLYAGLRSLDTVTGATSTDEILALIFTGFCIGK